MFKEKKMLFMVLAVILLTTWIMSDVTTMSIEESCISTQKMAGSAQDQSKVRKVDYSDVSVAEIYGDNCFCEADIASVGLLFQHNIWVKVVNEKCKTSLIKKKVSGKVIVEYYDHAGKRDVRVEKNFADVLNYESIKVITGKVLTKSIKATVILSGTVKDCNIANNTKIITQCQLAPLI